MTAGPANPAASSAATPADPATRAGVGDSGDPQRAAADPLVSAWVAASAGTGKTKVLTDRVLRLLLDDAPPHRLLCLTFTKAAAAEMANRIAAVLARWTTLPTADLLAALATLLGRPIDPDSPADAALVGRARRLFARVLDTPGGPRIQTIHAFCQAVLHRFPIEAGLAPHFEVLDDREALTLQAEARAALLARAAREEATIAPGRDPNSAPADDGPGWTLPQALANVLSHVAEDRFEALLIDLLAQRATLDRALQTWGGPEGVAAAVCACLEVRPDETVAGLMRSACTEAAFDGPGLRAATKALLASDKVTDQKHGTALALFLGDADPAVRADLLPAYAQVFLTREGAPRKTLATAGVEAKAPGTRAVLEAEQTRLMRLEDRRRAVTVARATAALVHLGAALLADYATRKRSLGRLDFADLIARTRALLEREGAAAWVLFKLDGGLDHLLIDEAQDTSPDQWAIAARLADAFFDDQGTWDPGRPRTVFAVGDRKQSIYGFQGADPVAFEAMRRHFQARLQALGGRFATLPLNLSFRSTPAVLAAVNAVFARDPARDGVVIAGEDATHVAHRAEDGGLVELWPPIRPDTEVDPDPWKPPVERIRTESPRSRLARRLARRIRQMTDGSEHLESQGRPIHPGDILVLVRRRGGFETELVSALKELGVPVAGVDRLVLTEQIAVMDLMALGRALLLPEDDLSLACALKSPLFGLDDDDLFALAHDRPPSVRLWQRLGDAAARDPRLARLRATLEDWQRDARRRPPYDLFARILDTPVPAPPDSDDRPPGGADDTGRRRLLARLGPEAQDPLDEFLALALAFERLEPPSLQGFLAWLDAGAVEIKRDMDQGTPQAVRIMTVHGSKGLQAPIVFLPDTLAVPTQDPVILWDDPAADEAAGVAGVAVAPDPLHPAPRLPLWCPTAADRTDRITAHLARLRTERDREYRRLLYVALTRAADRLYICGWETKRAARPDCWHTLIRAALAPLAEEVPDPLEAEAPQILRLTCPQIRPPTATTGPDPRGSADAPPAWVRQPPSPEPTPSRPLAPSHLGEDPPVRSPRHSAGSLLAARAGGLRRGHLIHRLLQILPDLPPDHRAAAARQWLSRPVWALDPAQATALADEALAVLEDPEVAPLFAPGARAEVPVIGRIGRHVLSGQVDRLWVGPDRVLVADYKTNRPPPATPDKVAPLYLRQMAAYRAVLAGLFPGRAISCLLIWTDGPRVMPLPDPLLDTWAARLGAEDGPDPPAVPPPSPVTPTRTTV